MEVFLLVPYIVWPCLSGAPVNKTVLAHLAHLLPPDQGRLDHKQGAHQQRTQG